MYQSTKRYAEGQGLSCAFRQPKAHSHCKYLHGYALSFKFKFEASELDNQNWVIDFGGLKSLRNILETNFDHKTIVCENDPHMAWFQEGQARGVLDLIVVPEAGCEKFAELVFEAADCWLKDAGYKPRVTLVEVEVSEHGGNSAIYINPALDITKQDRPLKTFSMHDPEDTTKIRSEPKHFVRYESQNGIPGRVMKSLMGSEYFVPDAS